MSERRYDKTVADTFPASDPPANSGVTGAEPSKRQGETEGGDPTTAEPTGRPTSDRHNTETAAETPDENRK